MHFEIHLFQRFKRIIDKKKKITKVNKLTPGHIWEVNFGIEIAIYDMCRNQK